jgi:hypothetical protein
MSRNGSRGKKSSIILQISRYCRCGLIWLINKLVGLTSNSTYGDNRTLHQITSTSKYYSNLLLSNTVINGLSSLLNRHWYWISKWTNRTLHHITSTPKHSSNLLLSKTVINGLSPLLNHHMWWAQNSTWTRHSQLWDKSSSR